MEEVRRLARKCLSASENRQEAIEAFLRVLMPDATMQVLADHAEATFRVVVENAMRILEEEEPKWHEDRERAKARQNLWADWALTGLAVASRQKLRTLHHARQDDGESEPQPRFGRG